MIIAIDFDGTIVKHEFPNIGPLMPNAKEVINKLAEEGHKIIVWTCRTMEDHFPGKECTVKHVENFLLREEISYHQINKNVPEMSFQPFPKVYADVYVDDRQLGGIPEDWWDIYEMIQEHPKYESN